MSQPLIMSFRPDAAEMCLDGRKTMTRRIAKPTWGSVREIGVLTQILDMNFKTIWSVGSSIAIKPGRTCKAVGRVMCTELRVERVQDITDEDAIREGVGMRSHRGPIGGEWAKGPIGAFWEVWEQLHGKRSDECWNANPLVVAIGFRPLREGES